MSQKLSFGQIRPWLILGFVGVMLIVIANAIFSRPPSISSANPNNPQAVALGRGVYVQHCASCHGGNLEGQPNWQTPNPDGTMPAPPHDPSGHTWHHTDESLFTTVKYGSQATSPPGYPASMPGFGSVLSDDEIYAVLAYIKSTWPPEVQQLQREGGH